MDEKQIAFLKAVVGEDGAEALIKAAYRSTPIENAIIPRAIMAWLTVAARFDYEGEIPGLSDSYFEFAKNEEGTYNGTIAINEGVYPFENANIIHLAASMAVALGSDDAMDPDLRDLDLARLGKSIDLLAKARYAATEIFKAEAPGPSHAPTEQEGATAPQAPTKQPRVSKRKPMMQVKDNNVPAPKAKVQTPKIPGVPKAFPLSAKAMKRECQECGLPLIKGEKFVGCMCLKGIAKDVTLRKTEQGTIISFSRDVDPDEIGAVLETLGVL